MKLIIELNPNFAHKQHTIAKTVNLRLSASVSGGRAPLTLFQFNCLKINCLLTVKKATHKVLTTNNKYYLKLELKGMWSIDNGHGLSVAY